MIKDISKIITDDAIAKDYFRDKLFSEKIDWDTATLKKIEGEVDISEELNKKVLNAFYEVISDKGFVTIFVHIDNGYLLPKKDYKTNYIYDNYDEGYIACRENYFKTGNYTVENSTFRYDCAKTLVKYIMNYSETFPGNIPYFAHHLDW